MEDFEQAIIEAIEDAYLVRFIDYKDKVAQVYPQLDLSGILVVEVAPKEGKEERTAEEEAIGAQRVATKELEAKVAITEGPK